MSKYSRLTGGAAAAVAGLALLTGSASAQTFTTTTITNYATQAVTVAAGAITVPAETIAFLSPTTTATTTAGSFLITFTLPTGVTFSITPTVNVTGAACTPAASLVPSGGGNGSNNAVFTITNFATAAAGGTCTVTVNAFTLAGATQLQSKTTSASSSASGFAMTEQVSASTGQTPSFNQAVALPTGIASSTSALSLASSGVNAATINVLPPSNGQKISQPGLPTTNVAWVDLGALNTTLNVAQNATATGQYVFTGVSTTDVITGNFTGATSAYVAPIGTLSCATTFGGRPAGALVGTLSGNTFTFSGVAAGFNGFPGVAQVQEACVYYTGTTIIGPNPAASPFVTTAAVDTTTITMSSAAPLATETYNGVVQQIQYSGNFTTYPEYIRIVNNTAGPIQVFAVVQSDSGSTGTATVETALAANTNDLVPATTVLTNSGVTLNTSGRASMILLGPTGTVFSQLMQQPLGLIDNIQ